MPGANSPKQLTAEQAARLLSATAADARTHAMLCLLANDGLKPIDLVALRISDVDRSGARLRLPVRRGRREALSIALADETRKALTEYLHDRSPARDGDESPLFAVRGRLADSNAALSSRRFRAIFAELAKEVLGVDASPNQVRGARKTVSVPATAKPLPKPPPRQERDWWKDRAGARLEPREVLQVLDAARGNTRTYAMLCLLAYDDLTPGELRVLKRSSYDASEHLLTVPARTRQTSIPDHLRRRAVHHPPSRQLALSQQSAAALDAYLPTRDSQTSAADGPLFITGAAEPLRPLSGRYLRTIVERLAAKTLGLDASPNMLRPMPRTDYLSMTHISGDTEAARRLLEIVALGTERSNHDYKGAMAWPSRGPAHWHLMRHIIGLANTRDGGDLVFGVEDRTGRLVGLTGEQLASFDATQIASQVAAVGSPAPTATVTPVVLPHGRFVLLHVDEAPVPVICTKTVPDTWSRKAHPPPLLREAAIYVRTGAASTTEVRSVDQMRELLERCMRRLLANATSELLGSATTALGDSASSRG